ncbi:MAG TPA: hypothetical protein VLD83_08860 [Candidatus Binatia bacterium]|nr:hypothetical protein [Candidatus Binatia bacterium]
MIRLLKSLVKLAALLCFTLGAFAVSFAAHDPAPSWSLVTAGAQPLPAKNPAQLTPYASRFGSGSYIATGELPKPSRLDAKEVRLAYALVAEPLGALGKPPIHTAKVSLHIFELVLLL